LFKRYEKLSADIKLDPGKGPHVNQMRVCITIPLQERESQSSSYGKV